nr:low temperature requirement protein A [Bacteroides xylanisolvens]
MNKIYFCGVSFIYKRNPVCFIPPHPLLRKRETETATVSYSELLFDLIYVFSVTQLSHYLLHNLTWAGLLKETILWFAVWMLW